MGFRETIVHKPALLIGFGAAIFATTASLTSAVLRLQPSLVAALRQPQRSAASESVCKTIATDPKPPLNVRSSPVVAPDNVVGSLQNGVQLTVVDENEGWVRISSPLEGWVYKDLTVTSCIPTVQTNLTSADSDMRTLMQATEQYQIGNLNAAIALAQTIPATSAAHQSAKAAITQWQRDWKLAETEFNTAQTAIDSENWQDVLMTVKNFPDNRFWRTKLTPLVKEAIRQQNVAR